MDERNRNVPDDNREDNFTRMRLSDGREDNPLPQEGDSGNRLFREPAAHDDPWNEGMDGEVTLRAGDGYARRVREDNPLPDDVGNKVPVVPGGASFEDQINTVPGGASYSEQVTTVDNRRYVPPIPGNRDNRGESFSGGESSSGGNNGPGQKKKALPVIIALVVAVLLLTAAGVAAKHFWGTSNDGGNGETDTLPPGADPSAGDVSEVSTDSPSTTQKPTEFASTTQEPTGSEPTSSEQNGPGTTKTTPTTTTVPVSTEKPTAAPTSGSDELLALGTCGDNVNWQLNSGGVLKLNGTGATSGFADGASTPWHNYAGQVRSIVVGEGISAIGVRVFSECVNVETVSLPQSLKEINNLAFKHCKRLRGIEIPAGVTKVSGSAFDDCGALESISVANGNTSYAVFRGALVTADGRTLVRVPSAGSSGFVIPDSVETIGLDAFCASGIRSIEIPAGVTSVAEYAFDECWSLREITVDRNNPVFTAENGVLYSKDKSTLIVAPPALTGGRFTIPDTVETVEKAAFDCTGLSEIVFPASVQTVNSSILSLAQQDVTLVFLGDAPAMKTLPSIEEHNVTIRYDSGASGWDELRAKDTNNSIRWIVD